MSKITKKEVEHVAHLARLHIPEERVGMLTGQMNQILSYMEKLNELDTKDVEPTSHPVPLPTAWREDEVSENRGAEDALANSPERANRYIVVPKIIE